MKQDMIENEFMIIWTEDNIMYASYKTSVINLAIAKSCLEIRVNASKGKSFPLLVDARKVKSMDKASREYFSSEVGYRHVKANALIVDSAVSKVIGNFFFKVNKPPIPTRIFNNQQEALIWLEQFKDQP